MSSSTRNSLIDLTLEDSDEEIGVNVVVTHPACTIDLLSPVPRNRTHKNDDLDSKHAGSNEFGSSQQSDSARSLFEMVTGKASTLKSKSTIDLVSPLNPNQAHNAADDDYTDPDLNSGPLGLSILDLLAIQERQHVVSQKTTASSIGTQVKTTHSQNTKRDTPHEGEVRSPFLDGNQKRQKSCYGDDAEDSSQRLEADDKSPQMMSTNEFDLPSLLQNVVSAKSTSSSQGHEALSTKTANPAKPRKKTKAINKSPQLAASNTLDNFLGIPPSTSAIPPAQSTAQPVPHSPTASALLQAGYEVVLFVDKREKSHDTIIASLLADKVRCELRTLAVGDFLWVARPPSVSSTSNFNDNPADTSSSAAENVYVLDCIAERKTIADLVSSVLDGRYKEQKTRLASLTIPHCFYIVEAEYMAVNPYMQVHCPSMGIESVKTAMVSTNMQDKMHVIRTKGGEHTVRTLVQITRQVQRRFQASTSANTSSSSPSSAPQLMTFAAFQQAYVKQHCADYGECLTHMLRQVRGCSLPSAMALTRQFSTMKKLGKFFREVDKGFATRFISNLHRHEGSVLAQRANDGNEHPGSQIIDEENEENENTVRNGATAAMASDIGHRGASAKRIRRRLGDSVGKLICEVFTDEY